MSVEPKIDINEINDSVLISRQIELDRGTNLEVSIKQVTYPIGNERGEPKGERRMFAVCMGPLVYKLVQGPLKFSSEKKNTQIENELRTLGVIGHLPGTVSLLPNAFNKVNEIYESTIPGIPLSNILNDLLTAYIKRYLSEDEFKIILHKIYSDAKSLLDNLHKYGVKHCHPHCRNFNIEPSNCAVGIFDFTTAEKTEGKNLTLDEYAYLNSWLNSQLDFIFDMSIEQIEDITYSDEELESVIKKIEPIILRSMLHSLGINNVSDSYIQKIMDTITDIILECPTIVYPKDYTC